MLSGWSPFTSFTVRPLFVADSSNVMKLLVEDLGTPKTSGDITDVITHNRVVTQQHWQAINAAEVAAGEPLGKPRRKFVDHQELLNSAGV